MEGTGTMLAIAVGASSQQGKIFMLMAKQAENDSGIYTVTTPILRYLIPTKSIDNIHIIITDIRLFLHIRVHKVMLYILYIYSLICYKKYVNCIHIARVICGHVHVCWWLDVCVSKYIEIWMQLVL